VLGKTAFSGGADVRRDTIFRIASMAKPVTTTAVMMLVEEGKLKLDEPVDRLLPELADRRVLRRIDAELDDTVQARRPLTVEDLLTFRSSRTRAKIGCTRQARTSREFWWRGRRASHCHASSKNASLGHWG